MLLKLPSDTRIAVPPYFLLKPRTAHLRISTGGVFHPDHITTRLCLDLLDRELGTGRYRSMLDVGCGSGALALLAAYKGVPFVVGLDIDWRSVALSRKNAEDNSLTSATHWILGTVLAVDSEFESIAANLPYGVIMEILENLTERMAPEGVLILSGFQDIQWQEIYERIAAHGLRTERIVSGDQSFYGIPPSGSYTWMAVQMRKEAPGSLPAASRGAEERWDD